MKVPVDGGVYEPPPLPPPPLAGGEVGAGDGGDTGGGSIGGVVMVFEIVTVIGLDVVMFPARSRAVAVRV